MKATLLLECAIASATADFQCIGCQILVGLAGQGARREVQKELNKYCDDSLICKAAVNVLLSQVSAQKPDKSCKSVGWCDGTCKLYSEWPVNPPPKPPTWPPKDDNASQKESAKEMQPTNGKDITLGAVLARVGSMVVQSGGTSNPLDNLKFEETLGLNPCGTNITCNSKSKQYISAHNRSYTHQHFIHETTAERFSKDHLQLVDADGDGFGDAVNGSFLGWYVSSTLHHLCR